MGKKLSEMSLEELWQLFPIFLTENQTCWKEWYFEEEKLLKNAIPQIQRISHIGSTAISSIWAKPIIDILVEIPRECDMSALKDLIVNSGYICMAQSEDRISFNKGYTENGFADRVFHLHLRYAGDHDELYFRDYLMAHIDVADEYEKMKLKLWKEYEHNRDGYTNAKAEFVKKYTEIAKQLYAEGGIVMEERAKRIIETCLQEKSKNPIEIFHNIAKKDFVRIHGPEHHVLDGAALLTAFHNAGGDIDLRSSLDELMKRGLQMPGATCGMWGVCGAVSSMGAALSIMDGTGPLSSDSSWGKHMEFTSKALGSLSQVGGPRCCKRDAFLSYQKAIEHINENYDVELESGRIECDFYGKNEQCIKEKCPFYKKRKKKVAFICVHNSCRSQIAEALGKHLASDVFESYSAGTETKPQINQDAVRIMKELYGIDMEQAQYSKLISDIPNPDMAISMGCNVGCPFIGRSFDDNWGLEDPTGKSDEEFKIIIREIESRILQLRKELEEFL